MAAAATRKKVELLLTMLVLIFFRTV